MKTLYKTITCKITITNLTTGQPLTPPVIAIHNSRADVFEVGEPASEGVRQIAENAGVDGAVVAGKVTESSDSKFGFNAQSEEYGDLIAMGIIDPAKVVRHALEDAASVAALLITTEAMIADKPEPKGAAAPAMPDMGGMGGMM